MTKAEIQFIRSLADKRARSETGLFTAEGAKLIGEILSSPLEVRSLYALEGVFDGRAERATPREMERISSLKTASDSLAVVAQPRYRTPDVAPADRLALALDGVRNPGNMGTIVRLADWFGIDDIFCSEDSADLYNPKVVQATMGAILRVRVHYLPLADFLARTAAQGIPVYGTAYDIAGKAEADAQSMRNAIYTATDIVRNRRRWQEWNRNPLQRFERDKGRDVSVKDLKLPETEE